MVHFYGCFVVARNAYSSFSYIKSHLSLNSRFIPLRSLIGNWTSKKVQNLDRNLNDSEMKPLTGIDDPNFTDHLKKVILKLGWKRILASGIGEFQKFYNETVSECKERWNFRIDSQDKRIDMLFTFETKDDLEKFSVYTDNLFLKGYTSASLNLTQDGTALFSGNICTDIPSDGNVKVAGYANFSNNIEKKSFFRTKFYDWGDYTHLVFKIRGDGRTYLVLINLPDDHEEFSYFAYASPLYTRGGPYWQIAKIPFTHFYLTRKGFIQLHQNRNLLLRQIKKFGITASGFDGPFKLEIDYIGLENDKYHKTISPYESYR